MASRPKRRVVCRRGSLVDSVRWELADVPFATNANDSYVADVVKLHYDEPLRGLDPVWQMVSPRGQHAVTASRLERLCLMLRGWRPRGVAFYTVRFPNA